MGFACHIGYCVSVDFDEAERYYEEAAELGIAVGYLGISLLHIIEKSDWNDRRHAYEMAKRAWDESDNAGGKVLIALLLGQSYEGGFGVGKSPSETIRYYTYAARQGLAEAQFRRGMLGLRRQSPYTPYDDVYWVFLAAEQGFQPAVRVRGSMASTKIAAQLAKFQRVAREELQRIAATDSLLGGAAEWCRENRPDSYECFRFALVDSDDCSPPVSDQYFDTRYIHSDAYDVCRREAFEARE